LYSACLCSRLPRQCRCTRCSRAPATQRTAHVLRPFTQSSTGRPGSTQVAKVQPGAAGRTTSFVKLSSACLAPGIAMPLPMHGGSVFSAFVLARQGLSSRFSFGSRAGQAYLLPGAYRVSSSDEPANKRMQLTKLRAAPVLQAEVPPCAPAGRMDGDGGTASQLIRGVRPTEQEAGVGESWTPR
jgi:hypothetical protein